jgi:hypothetical protein
MVCFGKRGRWRVRLQSAGVTEMMARSKSYKGDMVTGSDKDDDEVGEPQRRCICRAYTPGTHARKDEDGLLLEFPCNPIRTRSV